MTIFKSGFDELPTNVSIRFHDVRSNSATSKHNYTCGRVDKMEMVTVKGSEKAIPEVKWLIEEPNCALNWHPEGLTCVCSQTGTFGLIPTIENEVSVKNFFMILV